MAAEDELVDLPKFLNNASKCADRILRIIEQQPAQPDRQEWEEWCSLINHKCSVASLLRVGILGRRGVGKTSIINRLLGVPLLPVGTGASCTAAITEILHVDIPDFLLVIYFITAEEWSLLLLDGKNDLQAFLSEREVDPTAALPAKLEQLLTILTLLGTVNTDRLVISPENLLFDPALNPEELLPPETRAKIQTGIRIQRFPNTQTLAADLQNYVNYTANEGTDFNYEWFFIHKLEIRGSFSVLSKAGFSLLDIPGELAGNPAMTDRYARGLAMTNFLIFLPQPEIVKEFKFPEAHPELTFFAVENRLIFVNSQNDHYRFVTGLSDSDPWLQKAQGTFREILKKRLRIPHPELVEAFEPTPVEFLAETHQNGYPFLWNHFVDCLTLMLRNLAAPPLREARLEIETIFSYRRDLTCIQPSQSLADISFPDWTPSLNMGSFPTDLTASFFSPNRGENWKALFRAPAGRMLWDWRTLQSLFNGSSQYMLSRLFENIRSSLISAFLPVKIVNLVSERLTSNITALRTSLAAHFRELREYLNRPNIPIQCAESLAQVESATFSLFNSVIAKPQIDEAALKECLMNPDSHTSQFLHQHFRATPDEVTHGTGCTARMLFNLQSLSNASLFEALAQDMKNFSQNALDQTNASLILFVNELNAAKAELIIRHKVLSPALIKVIQPLLEFRLESDCEPAVADFQPLVEPEPEVAVGGGKLTISTIHQHSESLCDIRPLAQRLLTLRNWPSAGKIYVISNRAYRDNYYKVGFTQKPPEVRMKQLYTTGVPGPFFLVFSLDCKRVLVAERLIHECLRNFRPTHNREFFQVQLDVIRVVVNTIIDDLNER